MYLALSKLLNYRSHLCLLRRPIVRGCRLDDCAICFRIWTFDPFAAFHRKDHNIVFFFVNFFFPFFSCFSVFCVFLHKNKQMNEWAGKVGCGQP